MSAPNENAPGAAATATRGNNETSTAIVAQSRRWQNLERTAARKLCGRRIVREDFFQTSPDGIVDDFGLIIECKSRKRHAFHTYLVQAQKYCKAGEVPCLITKGHGEIGEYCTLPLDFVAALLDEIRASRLALTEAVARAEGDPALRNFLLLAKEKIGCARDRRLRGEAE